MRRPIRRTSSYEATLEPRLATTGSSPKWGVSFEAMLRRLPQCSRTPTCLLKGQSSEIFRLRKIRIVVTAGDNVYWGPFLLVLFRKVPRVQLGVPFDIPRRGSGLFSFFLALAFVSENGLNELWLVLGNLLKVFYGDNLVANCHFRFAVKTGMMSVLYTSSLKSVNLPQLGH